MGACIVGRLAACDARGERPGGARSNGGGGGGTSTRRHRTVGRSRLHCSPCPRLSTAQQRLRWAGRSARGAAHLERACKPPRKQPWRLWCVCCAVRDAREHSVSCCWAVTNSLAPPAACQALGALQSLGKQWRPAIESMQAPRSWASSTGVVPARLRCPLPLRVPLVSNASSIDNLQQARPAPSSRRHG